MNPNVTMCTSSLSYMVVSVMTMDDAPGTSLRKRMLIWFTYRHVIAPLNYFARRKDA